MENILMQALSLGMGIATLLFIFFFGQYIYTGLKKINNNHCINYTLMCDKKLKSALVKIEVSLYSIVLSGTTAYLVTIVM